MKEWLFISDLHLAPERPEIIRLFERFIDEIACKSHTLYILGDFLEYWIGDDDRAIGLESALSSLKRLSDSGTTIYFMHGNRDFLVGSDLARRCGFELIEEPYITEINQQKVLLMHGDILCTDDVEYQKFRGMVRNAEWQRQLLEKSLQEREQIAKSLREKSQMAIAEKSAEIMDVNSQAVIDTMTAHNVNMMIHGHTHRPGIHDFEINNKTAKRIVLGDWYKTGSYLKVTDNNELELNIFD